jgi:hypothetical protein
MPDHVGHQQRGEPLAVRHTAGVGEDQLQQAEGQVGAVVEPAVVLVEQAVEERDDEPVRAAAQEHHRVQERRREHVLPAFADLPGHDPGQPERVGGEVGDRRQRPGYGRDRCPPRT